MFLEARISEILQPSCLVVVLPITIRPCMTRNSSRSMARRTSMRFRRWWGREVMVWWRQQ
uniref:Mitogen-activated protein kinase 12-like n=1 Tax=Rhizophora mucronata TaxID=61149 RepID=A0A2P2PBU6_RHIMU